MKLAYERHGAGAQLVLVHGLGGERGMWLPLVPLLADRFEMVLVDLPGHGASPSLPADVDPDPAALAAAVAELLDSLGWERPHVVGNSLGGWVALELGRLGRAATVTGIGAAGLWAGPLSPKSMVMRRASGVLRPVLPLLLRLGAVRRLALSATVAHPERVPAADFRRLALGYTDAPDFIRVNRAMRASYLRGGETIRCPITLVWCEHDRLIRPPRVNPVPQARQMVLRGCGHVPVWDDPGGVMRAIEAGTRVSSLIGG